LAGTAQAPETANSPTAADVAAAKATILSVIELSCPHSLSKPGDGPETTEPHTMFDAASSPREQ
jgi:hypothetical protein